MWHQGQVPQGFRDVHLYGQKGNRQLRDHHRDTALFVVAGKISARIILEHLNGHLEYGILLENQCGLRRYCGTTDVIFIARYKQEMCQEMRGIFMDAYRDQRSGIGIVNRAGDHPLITRRMQAPTRLSTATVYDPFFVEDCALNAATKLDVQQSITLLAFGCANFGQTSNTDRTIVMHMPSTNAEKHNSRITVGGSQLQTVDDLAYLGSKRT
nr:unnamed protein product [Spirometra erinaceieuropaei]